ncbi:putative serine/threonine protein kinase [Blattamonas nauphoetae]|uniref:Serine/threonine protein kinase n=1 Tax=Blattamonas nauphoetae TaxID=2049346 RepID=A0ABQ9XAX0_9EUKA|nr:putative serine/threonine protein kinase [Blattamonas nauphoetae]
MSLFRKSKKPLEIGSPQSFERVAGAKMNRDTGQLEGIPDDFFEKQRQMQAELKTKKGKKEDLVIGAPIAGSFSHTMHVTPDPNAPSGLAGLPQEWEQMLLQSGISKQEVQSNPDAILRIMEKNIPKAEVPSQSATDQASSGAALPTNQALEAQLVWDKLVESNVDVDTEYPIRKKIGEGSSGYVYVTCHNHKRIALKVMLLNEQTDLLAILSEIRMMKMCSSQENIISFHRAFSIVRGGEKQLWIAMDYAAGGSLTQVITVNGAMPERAIAFVCREMLKALDFLHKMHRIHRDIKSDNVLLDLDGSVRLADFGFCAQLTEELQKRKSVVGTPYWMSPELIQGLEYDQKTDIWSLGITALEMADSEPPLMNIPPLRALFLIATRPPPTLNSPERWSKEFNSFLSCCLTHNTKERYTAEQLLSHPFITQKAGTKADLLPFIEITRQRLGIDDEIPLS